MIKNTKKILATILPTGLMLVGAAGIAAADTSTYTYGNSSQNQNTQNGQNNQNGSYGTSTTNGWNSQSGSNNDTAMFSADTFGHNEVPPVPDMTVGHITVNKNTGTTSTSTGLSYTYTLQNGKGITMAHLHCAAPGENGPSVVTLYMSLGKDVNGTLTSGNISNADILPSAKGCSDTIGYEINNVQDLMQALENGDIYANAHSMNYPDGVSRGQLEQNGSNANTWNDSNNSYWNNNSNYSENYGQDNGWSNDQSNWNDSNSDDSNWNDNSDNSNDWNSDDSSDNGDY